MINSSLLLIMRSCTCFVSTLQSVASAVRWNKMNGCQENPTVPADVYLGSYRIKSLMEGTWSLLLNVIVGVSPVACPITIIEGCEYFYNQVNFTLFLFHSPPHISIFILFLCLFLHLNCVGCYIAKKVEKRLTWFILTLYCCCCFFPHNPASISPA